MSSFQIIDTTSETVTNYGLCGYKDTQQNPSPFSTFALILNGKIVSHHPISKNRLGYILRKEL